MPDSFSFNVPVPQEPRGPKGSPEEIEKSLLEKLKRLEQEHDNAAWELIWFYSRANRQELAMPYLTRLLDDTEDPERKAQYLLTLGQFMEQIRNYQGAIKYYTIAFAFEPANTGVWYYINNNLGYCLNIFGKYKEAEGYCRAAIQIEPRKHNAYKNLGISLEGQGLLAEAAQSYIQAVQANAGDPRAFFLLKQLVRTHPEIYSEFPNIDALLEECKLATRIGRAVNKSFWDGTDEKR